MTAAPSGTAPSSRRSSGLVAAGILLSRLAGLARESIIAAAFATGFAVDAFRAALRIPNVLQNLLGEGALSASFIPVYARLLADGDEEEAGRLAGAIAGLLAVVAAAFVVAGVVFARPLTAVLAPGYTGERFELTVALVRILTPGIGALVLSAWCLGVLNSHRRFFLSYAAPVLWNVAQIAVLLAVVTRGWSQSSLAVALAWGALAGGFLQLGVQLPAVRSLLGGLRPSAAWGSPRVRTVLRRFVPAVTGRGVVQLAAYIDLVLASYLAQGAVAALSYALVLYLLPISLFGMSVAAAELPELSRRSPAGGEEPGGEGPARIEPLLARVSFYVVPTALGYLVMGDLVVAALFERGRFGPDDTRLVWYVLGAFSLGLVATTSSRVLQSGLYAGGDTRGPAKIAAVRVALSAVLGAVLMLQLDRLAVGGTGFSGVELAGDLPAWSPLAVAVRSDPDAALRLGAVGLALASTVGAWLELGLLRRRIRPRFGAVRLGGGQLGATALAGVGAGAAALALRAAIGGLPAPVALGVTALPAGVLYVAAASRLGVDEASTLVATVRRRLRRS
ncbi:MAG: murein biosynthesis integral membrane protein MurJ [Actinobacteria bacterium]|nr:murein biosynthesis integral membrane protein MurJ [Actinomycetota bacterium]